MKIGIQMHSTETGISLNQCQDLWHSEVYRSIEGGVVRWMRTSVSSIQNDYVAYDYDCVAPSVPPSEDSVPPFGFFVKVD